jgi:hypothetical protein
MNPLRAFLLVAPLTFLLSTFSGCSSLDSPTGKAKTAVIGSYVATPRQEQVARTKAIHYYGALTPAKKAALAERNVRYLAVVTESPTPDQIALIKKSIKASPQAAADYGVKIPAEGKWELKKPVYCLMVWDTESHQVVGTNCYAFLKVPVAGSMEQFDTYSAQIIAMDDSGN